MITLLLLALVAAASFGALVLLGVPRRLWPLAGGTLLVGAAGYVVQGTPGLPAAPARADAQPVAIEPAFVDLRERMMGRYTADAAFFTAADALLRAGDRDGAARLMLGAVRGQPGDALLWTGLGTTVAIRDGDQLSPTALAAFRQAMRLAPQHPAPPFYLGFALLRGGDVARAQLFWRRALVLSPAGTSYHRDIGVLLSVLESAPQTMAPPPPR